VKKRLSLNNDRHQYQQKRTTIPHIKYFLIEHSKDDDIGVSELPEFMHR
jgi:hypothetical protein